MRPRSPLARRLATAACDRPTVPSLLAVVVVAVGLLVGACREHGVAVPTALPDAVAPEALPAIPKLAIEDELPAVGAPEAPVTLAFTAPADPWTERLDLRQTVRQEGPGLPRGESHVTQELTVRYAPAPLQDGTFQARVEAASIGTKPALPGVIAEAEAALQGLAWTARRGPRGRLQDVGLPDDAADAARERFGRLMDTLSQAPAVLPEGPVAAGASWTYETTATLRLAADVAVPATIAATATLRGVTPPTGDGAPGLAVLDVTVRQALRGPVRTVDLVGAVVGAAHGRGVVLFDRARGRVARSEFAIAGRQELLVGSDGGDDAARRHLVQETTLRLTTTAVEGE